MPIDIIREIFLLTRGIKRCIEFHVYSSGVKPHINKGTFLSLRIPMDKSRLEQVNGEADFWKQMAGASLTNLYAFQQAVITIRQHYFDGVELLFPDLDRSLAALIKHTEELITSFNDQVIKKS